MAIYAPGKRDRHNRPLKGAGRSALVSLSLTAMVDMFTVLVVFLLQNYQTTGEVIEISERVELPHASAVKELRPAHVVVLSMQYVMLDNDKLVPFTVVKEQADWMILPLKAKIEEAFKRDEEEGRFVKKLQELSDDAEKQRELMLASRRITIQADKKIDFLTVKKIMYTIQEAGASQVNFAVVKDNLAE